LSDTKQQLDLEALRSWLYRISEAGGSKATLGKEKPRRLKTSLLGGLILAALI